jgi:hypothetical protein
MKIDFGKCLRGTFSALARYFGSFLILTIGWAFLALAVFFGWQAAVIAAITDWPEFGAMVSSWEDERALRLLLIAPLVLVTVPGTVSMVVGWHRRIIQGIVPNSPFPIGLRSIFAYLGRGLLAFGIPGVPFVLFLVALSNLLPAQAGTSKPLTGLLLFVGLVAAALVAMRLSMMLPAVAVGDRSMTLAKTWSVTRGNTLRLFFGAFLAALPFSILGNICDKASESPAIEANAGLTAALVATGVLAELMSYASVAGFFSLAYLQLRDDPPPAPLVD